MEEAQLRILAHELRTSVSAVFASTNLLANRLAGQPEALHLVRVIRESSGHLRELVNNFLDLARIEAGQMRIERCECRLDELLSEVLSLAEPNAHEAGLTLDAECRGPIPARIQTDPTRLRQILLNLLHNAIKFTETGGVTVRVRLEEPTGGDEPGLCLDVIDTGPGLSEAQQRRAFEPFVQADDEASHPEGTGLGLAISERLAELLGGGLAVESTPGDGATFTLRIPAGPLKDTGTVETIPRLTLPKRPRKSENAEHGDGRLSGIMALVLEDRPEGQLLAASVLKSAGAAVYLAADAHTACELAAGRDGAAGRSLDLVLIGSAWSRDPATVTRRLREAGYAGPMLAMPAEPDRAETQRWLGAGCVDCVPGPFAVKKLVAAVLRATEG